MVNKFLAICILFLLTGCKVKQVTNYNNHHNQPERKAEYIELQEVIHPQYERRIPAKNDYVIVDSFFRAWENKSIPISQEEFKKLDTLQKFGYETYKSLITDTTFIGINPKTVLAKYILIPNEIEAGYTGGCRFEAGIVFFDNLKTEIISDFRPGVSFEKKLILYFTREYQDILPKFAIKYGVGGFIVLDSYLMSNSLRFYETAPVITRVIKIINTDNYYILYKKGSRSYETLVQLKNNRWVRIRDFVITESD